MQNLPVDIKVEILKQVDIQDIINVGRSSKSCLKNICQNDAFWQKLGALKFYKYIHDKPQFLSWIKYYVLLDKLRKHDYPLSKKPKHMKSIDYLHRLIYSGVLVSELYYNGKALSTNGTIDENIHQVWISNDKYFYLDVFGYLYTKPEPPDNVLFSYLSQSIKQPIDVDSFVVSSKILEIAIATNNSALILFTDHSLHSVEPKTFPPNNSSNEDSSNEDSSNEDSSNEDSSNKSYELVHIRDNVSRVWPASRYKDHYMFMSDDSEIFSFNNACLCSQRLQYKVDVPIFTKTGIESEDCGTFEEYYKIEFGLKSAELQRFFENICD